MDCKQKRNAEKALKPFPKNLTGLLDETHQTQEELASVLSKSRQAVSLYCNGSEPDFETLVKIAEHFSVSVDWLIGVPNAPKQINSSRASVMKAYGISEAAAANLERCSKEYHYVLDKLLSMDCFISVLSDLNTALNISLMSANYTDEYTLLPPTPKKGQYTGLPLKASAGNLLRFHINQAFSSLQKGFAQECKKARMMIEPTAENKNGKGEV